ncbi:hypothetical protein HQ520_13410 [bacterium]|nr:hypothetical protein [bacterium]
MHQISDKQGARNPISTGQLLLFNLVIVLFFLALCFLAGEMFLRVLKADALKARIAELESRQQTAAELLTKPLSDRLGFLKRHPYYGFTCTPLWEGTISIQAPTRVAIDRYGFRNGSLDWQNLPDEDLVIGLFGGSALFGHGIIDNENTISAQLERILRKTYGDRVHVVNLALPAWHQPQQFLAFSRVIDFLDLAIVCDGFNEITIPYWNLYRYDDQNLLIPPDFPAYFVYKTFLDADRPELPLERIALLQYESRYRPDSLKARSALYNWLRYARNDSRRHRLDSIGEESHGKATEEKGAPGSPEEQRLFEQMIEYGADDWARYSRQMDALAEQRSLPILHALQPFRYTIPDVPLREKNLPALPWARLFFEADHPSRRYAILRERARKAYGESGFRQGLVAYYDLSDVLPPDDEYWADFVHPTQEGGLRLAEEIYSILRASGLLDDTAVPSQE